MRPSVCSQNSGPVVCVVHLRIHRVVELIRQNGTRCFGHDALGRLHVVVRVIGRYGRGCNDDVGAERLEQPDLLLAHLCPAS